ncbi:hypothetical protein Trydic_g19135 [Trypoxylus dichotomus]
MITLNSIIGYYKHFLREIPVVTGKISPSCSIISTQNDSKERYRYFEVCFVSQWIVHISHTFLWEYRDGNLYEQLAQYIEFPCRYERNGCIERLKPDDLRDHESNCPHKPCLCPILPLGECQWQGDYQDLHEHCSKTHPTATFATIQLELDIVTPHEDNYVFLESDQTFIAQLKCDVTNNKLYCNVISCDIKPKTKTFSYRLRFTNNSTGVEFSSEQCSVLFTDSFQFTVSETTISIDINDIVINLEQPSCIVCKIDINVASTTPTKSKIPDKEDNEMLKTLECPVCFEYMMAPIAQCITGHSFCGSHKDQFQVCPVGCGKDIGDTRNYILERITDDMVYPCRYNKFGCDHAANAKVIKNHEASCIHGPYKCIIDTCQWENKFSELKNHLLQEHKDNVLEINSIIYIVDDGFSTEENSYIIFTNDNVFKLLFKQEDNNFLWSLQAADNNVDYSKYMLELDFTSQKREKIYIRKECGPLSSEVDDDTFIVLNDKHLRKFINDDLLAYKVRVVEIK